MAMSPDNLLILIAASCLLAAIFTLTWRQPK